MSWELAAVGILGGSMLLLFLGMPVAFTFLVVNVICAAVYMGGDAGLVQLMRNSVISVSNFSLTAIPLFILMGEVLFHTGLAVKVIEGVERIVRQVPGRLGVIVVTAGTIFSAISGSTIACTAMLGSLMMPLMLSRGYHPTMAAGPILAIGAVDVLIPPSALTVLLGSLSGISIAKLLIGGVTPGLIMAAGFVLYIVIRAVLRPELAPPVRIADYRGWEMLRPFVQYVIPLISIFGVVVASISEGWATPTESAALGALATILVAAVYRSLTYSNLFRAVRGAVSISCMILFIIIGATTYSQILSFSGASSGIAASVTGHDLPGLTVIAGMMLILVLLGVFIDQVSIMLITLPIFMPVVHHLQVDPVWFGILFLICMQLGLLLPPHGLLLMTMKAVCPPSVTMAHIFRAVVPFLAITAVVFGLVFFVPDVALWLPRVLIGGQ